MKSAVYDYLVLFIYASIIDKGLQQPMTYMPEKIEYID